MEVLLYEDLYKDAAVYVHLLAFLLVEHGDSVAVMAIIAACFCVK